MIRVGLVAIIHFAVAAHVVAQVDGAESRPTSRPSNPFKADEDVKSLLDQKEPAPAADDFRRLDVRPQLPEMKLRGLIRVGGSTKIAALIEITGVGTYSAREGDKLAFSVPARGAAIRPPAEKKKDETTAAPNREDERARAREAAKSGQKGVTTVDDPGLAPIQSTIPVVLKVGGVTRDGVTVEVGTLGEILIIR